MAGRDGEKRLSIPFWIYSSTTAKTRGANKTKRNRTVIQIRSASSSLILLQLRLFRSFTSTPLIPPSSSFWKTAKHSQCPMLLFLQHLFQKLRLSFWDTVGIFKYPMGVTFNFYHKDINLSVLAAYKKTL